MGTLTISIRAIVTASIVVRSMELFVVELVVFVPVVVAVAFVGFPVPK